MSKNIPITARVNKGLFNNKNGKVTEPLLSVGPAGVSGNNQTRPIPAPAKMTSPLKKSMAAGNIVLGEGDGTMPRQAKMGSTTTTPGSTTPGKTEQKQVTVKKAYVGKDKDACHPEYIKKNGRSACDKWKALSAEKKAAANTTTTTVTVNTPGTNTPGETKTEFTGLQTFREGDAMNSWERRSNDRAVIHTARKTKRAEIDLAKAQADKDGLTGKTRRDTINKAKKEAKLKQAEAKLRGLTGSREAAILQNEQSKKAGGTIKGTHLDPTKVEKFWDAEFSSKEDQFKSATGKLYGDSTNTGSGGTNPQATKDTTTKDTIKDAGKSGTTIPTTEVKKEEQTAPTAIGAKKVIGFFAKKSPLKMKYFK